jgi:hypothetical protein
MRPAPAASLTALALLAAAPGCGRRSLARQVRWVETHPAAPRPVKRAVLAKKLAPNVGMTPGAVCASWGEPDRTRDLGGGDARWTYLRDQSVSGVRVTVEYILVFRRGELVSVMQQRYR